MGRLVMIKCNCGYEYDGYRYGVNSAYPEIKKHQTALAKSGRYGKLWQKLLNTDPELDVNAEHRLYQCPYCHQITNEYCMDLYKSSIIDSSYYTPEPEEVIYHYKHICPYCKKKMTLIPISKKFNKHGVDNSEELAICPKCGDIAIIRFCGFTD